MYTAPPTAPAQPEQDLSPENPFLAPGMFEPEEPGGPEMRAAPVSRYERFRLNRASGHWQGSMAGAVEDVIDSRMAAGRPSEEQSHAVDRLVQRREDLAAYDRMPGSEGFLDYAAALAGQVVGSAESPEALLGFGARGATVLARIGWAAATQAGLNTVLDPLIQGLNIQSGLRDEYSIEQTAMAPVMGALIGGGMHSVGEAARLILPRRTGEMKAQTDAAHAAPELPPEAMTPDNPFIQPGMIEEPAPRAEPSAPVEAKAEAELPAQHGTVEEAVPAAATAEDADLHVQAEPDAALGDVLADRFAAREGEEPPSATRRKGGLGRSVANIFADAESEGGRSYLEKLSGGEPDTLGMVDRSTEGNFGPINYDFEGSKGERWREAVDWMRTEKAGEVPGAFHREGVGDIDLIYGWYDPATDKGIGFAKIEGKHPEAIDRLGDIITNGDILSRTENRIRIGGDDGIAVVRLDYDGEARTWLMTAYDPESRPSSGMNHGEGRGGVPRAEDTTVRPDGLQTDTSSVSRDADNIDVRGLAVKAREGSSRLQIGSGAKATGTALTPIRDIWRTLAKDLEAPAVRQGRMKLKGAAGEYNTRTGGIHIKEIDDVTATAHELGHWLEQRLGAPLAKALSAAQQELGNITAYSRSHTDPASRLAEGFAEFLRLSIENPAEAQRRAPKFAVAFEDLMKAEPKIAAAIKKAAGDLEAYVNASPLQVGMANLVAPKVPGFWERNFAQRKDGLGNSIGGRFDGVYAGLFDRNNSLAIAVRELARTAKQNTAKLVDLKAVEDPYKLARSLQNSYQAGMVDLMQGVVPYHSLDPASPALGDAIALATGRPNMLGKWDEHAVTAFGTYLEARRAVHEWDRFDAGDLGREPLPFPKKVYEGIIREYEASNPNAEQAAAMVHEWASALLTKEFEAGLITRDAYDLALAKPDYVPLMRDMSDRSAGSGGMGGGVDMAQAGLKQFRGSSRPVVNPLNALMDRAFRSAQIIAHNDAIRALATLGERAGPGSARIVEHVPAQEMKARFVDPMEALQKAAHEAGMAPADAQTMLSGVVSDLAPNGQAIGPVAIFRPEQTTARGENIVFYREGGELRALRLTEGEFGREVIDSLTSGLSAPINDWVSRSLQASAQALRLGVTSAPEFQIANTIRDQMTAWVYNPGYIPFVDQVRGIWKEIAGRELSRVYAQQGGIAGGANVALAEEALAKKDLQALAKKGFLATHTTSFAGIMKMVDMSETGTRLGVFDLALRRARKQGLSDYDAAQEATFAARDYIDFGRMGSRLAHTVRIVPFMNAALQGLDKSYRVLFQPAFKEALTKGEREAQKTLVSAWMKIGALTGLTMALRAAYIDDPEYDEVSDYLRATHWVFRVPGLKGGKVFAADGREIPTPPGASGVWVAVPKPYDFAAVLNLGERGVEMVWKRDPDALKKWATGALSMTAPPSIFDATGLKLGFELMTGQNTFTGAPIVPESQQGLEPWVQATAYTSEMSKAIARTAHAAGVNLSPMYIDHVITNTFGSWGRNVMAFSDVASGQKPDATISTAPITQRFFKEAYRGSVSTRDFWDQMSRSAGKMTQAAATYDALLGASPMEAAQYAATLDDEKRAFVVLEKSNFSADTKRLHPLKRAQDALTVIGGMTREIGEGRWRASGDEAGPELTSSERRIALDTLSRIRMWEARNGLALAGTGRLKPEDAVSFQADLDFLHEVLPGVYEDLSKRYAMKKVVPFESVRAVWPEMRRRLLEDGSDAEVKDLVSDAKGEGYELGAERQKKPKKTRPGIQAANR
ncbi:LPD38 domain-containing protein [Xanthobacter flavus]|uniref:LPD38 domain-containing protein n=1 Tax=Xanthobacter flavus TaxID=281 RepID=UPI003728AE33